MKYTITLPETSEELLMYQLSSEIDFPHYFCSLFKVSLIKKDFKTCKRIVEWLMSQSVVTVTFSKARNKTVVNVSCGEHFSSLSVPSIHADWYYLLSHFATEEISKEYDTN